MIEERINLTLPVSVDTIKPVLRLDRVKNALEEARSRGMLTSSIEERVVAVINDMAVCARELSVQGCNEFLYKPLHTEYGLPFKKVSHLPTVCAQIKWPSAFDNNVSRIHSTEKIAQDVALFVWNQLLAVDVENTSHGMHVLVQPGNPYLLPKPKFVLSETVPAFRMGYFEALLDNKEGADVTFLVENTLVHAHTLLLKQLEFFRVEFSGKFRESVNSNTPILFPTCDHKTFLALLHFLYIGTVKPESIQHIDGCLSLLELANFVQDTNLRRICIDRVFALISKESYIPILITQMQIQDPDLQRLCDWFAKFHPRFAYELDLETIAPIELLTLHHLAKKHAILELDARCADCLSRRITLNNGFEALCGRIATLKEKDLKDILIAVIKAKPDMFKELYEGRKGKYAEHWNAYKPLMYDPMFL